MGKSKEYNKFGEEIKKIDKKIKNLKSQIKELEDKRFYVQSRRSSFNAFLDLLEMQGIKRIDGETEFSLFQIVRTHLLAIDYIKRNNVDLKAIIESKSLEEYNSKVEKDYQLQEEYDFDVIRDVFKYEEEEEQNENKKGNRT